MARPGHSPPTPFVAPATGSIELRLSQIAQEINRKANITSVPTYSSIHLIAPNGEVWMLSVSNTGTLVVEQMPRS